MTTNGTTAPKLLYTPVEAAQALGISRSTLYTLLSSGEIRSVKVGALRRIPHVALADFVARLSATIDGQGPGLGAPSQDRDDSAPAASQRSGKLIPVSYPGTLTGRSGSPDSADLPPDVLQHQGAGQMGRQPKSPPAEHLRHTVQPNVLDHAALGNETRD
jgi:excisionase family DNA binding protein